MKYDFTSPGTPIEESERIPSEYIEEHLKRFFMIQLEALAYGLHTPEEVRNHFKGVCYFVECSCGIHARMATSNIYSSLIYMEDEAMIQVAKETFKDQL